MLARFTHNWTLKLTALVLSLVVWSHVRGQVNPWETMTFKARLKATAPRGFLLLNPQSLPKTVVVTLRGPRLSLRALKGPAPANPLATPEDAPLLLSSQLHAILDFSNPRKGVQNVPVKAIADIEDIEVVGSKPAEVSVSLDAAETRTLKIVPQIPVSNELEIEKVNLSAREARISGPSKILDRVQSLRVILNRSDLKSGVSRLERAPIEAVDAGGEAILGVPIEPAFVNIEIRAREKQSEKSVRVNAKIVGKPDGDFEVGAIEVEPSRIRIRGPRSALDEVKSLSVEINISNAEENISRRARVDLPSKVQAVSSSRVRVRVEINAREGSTPSPQVEAAPNNDLPATPPGELPAPANAPDN